MRNVYIYGDSLLKATVPDEELKYHFHLPEIMARYPSDRVQVTNRAKMGATVSKACRWWSTTRPGDWMPITP